MKNPIFVLVLIILSQLLLGAMPEPDIEYECKYVPVVSNVDSSDVSREIEMVLVCRPIQQKPPKLEIGEGEPRLCCEDPNVIQIQKSLLKSR